MADPAVGAHGVSEFISKAELAKVMANATDWTWSGFHRAAHHVEESDLKDGIPAAVLTDIVAVADRLRDTSEPFPKDEQHLYDTVNEAAAQLPHR
jgi:hypothetical protein